MNDFQTLLGFVSGTCLLILGGIRTLQAYGILTKPVPKGADPNAEDVSLRRFRWLGPIITLLGLLQLARALERQLF
jgi:hypothetical protein